MRRAALVASLAGALGACNASTGTLQLDLAAAPGSDVIANIDRLRLTLTNPSLTFEATRTAGGLDLVFEIDAVETDGVLFVEAFDASGAMFAVGQSPPFPLAGSDGTVVIYVAPPYSILRAATDLLPARSKVAGATLIYGAVLAGGLDAAGIPSATMAIYNAYDHTIGYGEDMPVRRAGVTLAVNDTAGIYIFGGTDESSIATSSLYRFQSNVAPRGVYADLGAPPGLETSEQRAIKLGPDRFFITGFRPTLLDASAIASIDQLANVPATATLATTVDDEPLAAFVRDGIVGTYSADDRVGEIPLPSIENERAIVPGLNGTVVVVGGATRDIHRVRFVDSDVMSLANVLSVARRSPTVAATARHILVANGLDENGAIIETADILDAKTLELITTRPLSPRERAIALPLTNGQILLAGGETPGEPPTGLVELFTPPIDPALQ